MNAQVASEITEAVTCPWCHGRCYPGALVRLVDGKPQCSKCSARAGTKLMPPSLDRHTRVKVEPHLRKARRAMPYRRAG
jgi:hypothetical protein